MAKGSREDTVMSDLEQYTDWKLSVASSIRNAWSNPEIIARMASEMQQARNLVSDARLQLNAFAPVPRPHWIDHVPDDVQ